MEVARSGPVSRRGWAAIALGDFGPTAVPAIPVLIAVLKDATPDDTFERASSAAVALGKIAPKSPSEEQAIAALVPVLQSKASLARAQAIEALAQFGPRAAAAIPGIRALEDDRDLDVREAVKKALPAIETGSKR
jgi:HEAT repeat protein